MGRDDRLALVSARVELRGERGELAAVCIERPGPTFTTELPQLIDGTCEELGPRRVGEVAQALSL